MSPPRTPVVLGIDARVGATTLAAALHAHDGGHGGGAADVVVCSGTDESLRRAELLGFDTLRPLLAVVAAGTGPGRLRHAGRRYASVTLLPYVERWRGLAEPGDEVAMLLGQPPEHLPPALRAYADGLRVLAAGMLGSGQLRRERPPAVRRDAVPTPRRGPRAVADPPGVLTPGQPPASPSPPPAPVGTDHDGEFVPPQRCASPPSTLATGRTAADQPRVPQQRSAPPATAAPHRARSSADRDRVLVPRQRSAPPPAPTPGGPGRLPTSPPRSAGPMADRPDGDPREPAPSGTR